MSNQSDRPRPARRTTVPELRAMKHRGEKICMVTAYDATFGRLVDEAGVDAILVGDSLGMVVQGLDTTLPVTLGEVIYHCRAVARGSAQAHLVCDLPFLTYQVSSEDALRSAGRVLKEAGAQSVKLEGGEAMASTVARLVSAGVPVMGHVGLTPQSFHAMGGFRVQGRGDEGARRLLQDARAIADAGAYAIVLEGIPAELAATVTAEVPVPTIGIGAGPGCDGQVLVCYDLLGMSPDFQPRFVKRFADLWGEGLRATQAYCEEVREGRFPSLEHSFSSTKKPRKKREEPRPEATGYGPGE